MRNYILSEETAGKKIVRMAYEIAEQNAGEEAILLAGIRDNGTVIARRLASVLTSIFPGKVDVLEVSLDKRNPGTIQVDREQDFNGLVVIVVDDVANTGKTMLYALKPFLQFHPKKIQTLALVDRTHKTFPVHTDYIGYALATTLQEHIFVEVEGERILGAYLE